ncbi:L-lactate permease, partial [Escherichia coli]|nr:L-lactate permease [Escherichia coli]
LAFAQWNYEFPALIGGAIGLTISIVLARLNIGMEPKQPEENEQQAQIPRAEIIKAMSPTLLLIAILIITRIQQLGIKQLLTDSTQLFTVQLGHFAEFSVSNALILKLSQILGTDTSWAYKTLYVPALIPFLLVVLVSALVFKMSKQQ